MLSRPTVEDRKTGVYPKRSPLAPHT